MVVYFIMAVIAYLIGSVNFSVLISKKMAGFDVREKGSGNAGTTNVLRTVGKRAAALTLVLDILKGFVAIFAAVVVGWIAKNSNKAVLVEIAAICVVLGHTFPIFFGFKGGKGVATSIGILLFLNWKIGLICVIFGVFLIAITRMVSLGSISGAVLFAVLTLFIHDGYVFGLVNYDVSFIIFGILLATIVIINHRENLKRIISGNENRISFKKAGQAGKSTTESDKSEKINDQKLADGAKKTGESKAEESKPAENDRSYREIKIDVKKDEE